MSQTIFAGPTPPQTNPPIHPEYYLPQVFIITAITLGMTTTVTIAVNHDYVIGQTIRLLIPPTYGSRQLNGQQGYVISIPAANQVITSINSLGSDAFVIGPTTTPAQIIAIGDINNGQINTSRNNNKTFIPGSFIDISSI